MDHPKTAASPQSAGHLAGLLASLHALGVRNREVYNGVLRSVLDANPHFLGVWSVWQPDALDGRDHEYAGAPGHDESGRFVPLWHRFGGEVQLEPNTDYDEPGAQWYRLPACRGSQVVIDPYEYRVGGENLFIASQAAPIKFGDRCVGVAGFDVHMDVLIDADVRPRSVEPIENALNRHHVILDDGGDVRFWSPVTRQLIWRYVGGRPAGQSELPAPLHEMVASRLQNPSRREASWTFPKGTRELVIRFTRHPHAGCVLLLVEERGLECAPLAPESGLSLREREVADWMCQGKSNEEISIILGISAHTVKNHLEKIFRKLGVENRHAAALAFQREYAESAAS
ncbi:hypothetical protein DB345_15570 [Spartobacteria bacterium LR76]|nr:hypothetical protein DB345_15570 [Spartobacteria bacterium LR76]